MSSDEADDAASQSTAGDDSSSSVLTAAVAGGAASLAAPMWGWPQRHGEPPRDPAPTRSETSSLSQQETSVTPPDDPPMQRRTTLPAIPKISSPTNGAAVAAAEPAPAGRARRATAPTPSVIIKPRREDATMVMSPPPPAPAVAPASAMKPIPAPPQSSMSPAVSSAAPVAAKAASASAAIPTAEVDAVTAATVNDESYPPTNPEIPLPVASDISESFNLLFLENGESDPQLQGGAAGVSTEQDLAAVRDVFNEIAVVHVAQVRDVMLELRYGDADPAWLESTKPALRSLRAMAEQMELGDLCGALDAFCVTVDAAVANRARISEDDKVELLSRYQRLTELIPQAFELDAERDRREPIIVEALLYQIDGVEKPVIDRLFEIGLNRLDALMQVNLEDLVAVSGVRREVGIAIVEQFRTYRATADAAVSTRDPAAERRSLGDLVIMLSILQDDFLRASDDWSEDARLRKRSLRKEREQTFQRVRVSLVRLGDRDQLSKLERLPFHERIVALERYVANQPPSRGPA